MTALYYIDSSVAIHLMDYTDEHAVAWFDERMDAADRVVSSSLLRLEVTRYLQRQNRPATDAEDLFDRLDFAPIDEALIDEATAVEPYIKTLDSLHLATALRMGRALTALITDDSKMAEVAGLLGMATHNPLTDERS